MLGQTYLRYLANELWVTSGSRHHRRFVESLRDVAGVQSRYLSDLLRRNARTRFGARHGFGRIASVAEYQERVPVTGYDGLGEHIEAIARGEDSVLTADEVRLFQPTSGSSSATKLIPWTASLGREFRQGIAPWIYYLYRRKPALLRGTAYWSVSPPVSPSRTHGRLRVGFDHDAQYLGFLGRRLFALVSAVPPDLIQCPEMSEFRKQTLLSLLADEDLSLISVWSPTFLTALLDEFLHRQDEVLELLNQRRNGVARKRTDFIRSAARAGSEDFFEVIWPKLQLISCWTHGPSELYARNLRRFFPEVEVQGKGLVATEAFVSLPFYEDRDPVLAVTSHFFEFQDPMSKKILLAHELSNDGTYQVIVTTGGGLYRYPLGDLVRVTSFIHEAPCLRFVGREGNLSDLFGEKLNGIFVEQVVRRLLAQHDVNARFFLLAPVAGKGKAGYVLFLDADGVLDAVDLQHSLEAGLCENFHYAHCRQLGQLREAAVFLIDRGVAPAEVIFQQVMLSRGLKLGDIKMAPLDSQSGWERRFAGRLMPRIDHPV